MERVEQALRSVIQRSRISEASRGAVEHGVFSGGKRVRPRFLLALATDVSAGVSESTISNAAAIELLHCASLVHDDLPALDNDLLRRGKPTVHAEYGAGVATLAGDIIAALPFLLPDVRADLIAHAYTQLCDGQVLDLKRAKSSAELLEIHKRKTGALFAVAAQLACVEIPDIALSGSAMKSAALAFGEVVGIEFQLRNDVDDSKEARGCEESSDQRNRRLEDTVRDELPKLLELFRSKRILATDNLEAIASRSLRETRAMLAEIFPI